MGPKKLPATAASKKSSAIAKLFDKLARNSERADGEVDIMSHQAATESNNESSMTCQADKSPVVANSSLTATSAGQELDTNLQVYF